MMEILIGIIIGAVGLVVLFVVLTWIDYWMRGGKK